MARFFDLLCPDEIIDSVTSLDIDDLKSRGIRALLMDLDNTLVAWQGYDIPQGVTEWIHSLDSHGIRVCIVSNTRSPRRLRKLAEELGVLYAKQAFKPRRKGFREALSLLGVDSSEVAVIGDQIFTDILGGNRLGAYTVLVCPMHRREFLGTKVSRVFERVILRQMRKQGMVASHAKDTGLPREQ